MLWVIPNTEQQVGMEMTRNFQGGVSKKLIQGLIKKEVELGVIKIKSCGVFRGLGSFPLEFPKGSTRMWLMDLIFDH